MNKVKIKFAVIYVVASILILDTIREFIFQYLFELRTESLVSKLMFVLCIVLIAALMYKPKN